MAGERSALLIGASRFDDTTLARLPAAGAAVDALAHVMAAPDIGDHTVSLLTEPTVQDTRVAVERFVSDAQPGDLKVFYFAGHGLKTGAGDLYFAVADTALDLLASTAVSADFVSRAMDASPARIVLIVDCLASWRAVEHVGRERGSPFTSAMAAGLGTGARRPRPTRGGAVPGRRPAHRAGHPAVRRHRGGRGDRRHAVMRNASIMPTDVLRLTMRIVC
jgi:hypothetical protein